MIKMISQNKDNIDRKDIMTRIYFHYISVRDISCTLCSQTTEESNKIFNYFQEGR